MKILAFILYIYCCDKFFGYANGQIDASSVPSVLVELGIICDKEYSHAFDYNVNKIKTYVRNLVEGLNIDFQTLTSVRVSFALTSIYVITEAYMQPFIEQIRSNNGEADLHRMAPLFRKWVYQKEVANKSDIVLLFTGSQGQYNSVFSTDGLCYIDPDDKEHGSYMLIRSARSTWVFQKELSSSIAQILGAIPDRNTACTETDLLMGNSITVGTRSHHYFSKCSDTAISRKVQSPAAHCLRSTQAINYGQGSEIVNVSVTFSEQCNLRYGSSQVATSHPSTESCTATTCYISSSDGTATPIGRIVPLHNSPCIGRKTSICFRGECLVPGSMLIQPRSQKCLVPSQYYTNASIIKLTSCPKRPLRYEKLSLQHFATLGTLFMATDNIVSTSFQGKCLAIRNNSLQIYFERHFASLTMGESMWDLLELGDGTSEVLICNRVYKSCLSANSKGELVLSKGLDSDDQSKRWKFDLDLADDEPELLHIPVESQYIAKAYLRILLVCDMNCGKIFKFNATAAESYKEQVFADVKSKLETLASSSVSLFVTSVVNLWTHDVPGFFDVDATHTNQTMETIYRTFGRWAFKQFASNLPRFDVAVLFTAGITKGPKTYSRLSTACKKTSNNMFEASIILQVDKPKANNCDELADAFAKIISSSNTPASCGCAQNPYYIPKCKNLLIWDFLTSDKAACLKDSIQESELHSVWAPRATHVPSFQDQCNFNRINLDLIVKKEDENCFETPCRAKGSYNMFVRNLYPLHRTPCGTDKYCVRGRCIERGYQLQHLRTEGCITGAKLFSPYDRVYAAPCDSQESFSFVDYFKITPIEENSTNFFLSTHSFQTDDNKCLTVNTNKEYLQYKPCSNINVGKEFIWNFRQVDDSGEYFLLYHNQTNKCVTFTPLKLYLSSTNHSFVHFTGLIGTSSQEHEYVNILHLTSKCPLNDISLQWRKYHSQNDITEEIISDHQTEPTRPKTTTISTTITTTTQSTTKQSSENITEPIVTSTLSTLTKALDSEINDEDPWKYIAIVIGIISGVALIVVASILVTRKYLLTRPAVSTSQEANKNYKWLLGEDFYQGKLSSINPELDMTDQVELLPFDSRWEIPFDRLMIGKMIGGGAFGNVFKGKVMGTSPNSETVAIKVISANADSNHFSALKSELKILSNMGRHLNIVNLVGACTKQFNCTGKLYMIIEYCKFGNLRDFVLNNRKHFINDQSSFDSSTTSSYYFHRDFDKSKAFSTQDLIFWAFQTACGMEYLASKRVLHGDLAARNILIAENNVAKICDFGLSKELTRAYNYNYKKNIENAKVPYKWMAIESLKCGVLSARSDCWSYGIVLWELFSLGDTPYPGVQVTDKFIDQLTNGYRMEKPAYAPRSVYNIMCQCWSEDSHLRPSFSNLATQFNNMLCNELCEYYDRMEFNFSDQTYATISLKGKEKVEVEEDYDGYLSAKPSTSQSVGMQSDLLIDFGNSSDIDQFVSGVCNLLDNKQGFHYVKR